jgi:L-methionine (R)-S-oxide reductase
MTKLTDEYSLLGKQLAALLEGESNPITNLSQFSALIFNSLSQVNWAGFYLMTSDSLLQLGPFQGQVACTKIPIGKGVCGTAAKSRQSQLVADVNQFAGHIACDSRSRSEVVCPLVLNGQLIGVFDLDSPELNRFDQQDQYGIECLVQILIDKTDFGELKMNR